MRWGGEEKNQGGSAGGELPNTQGQGKGTLCGRVQVGAGSGSIKNVQLEQGKYREPGKWRR